MALALPGQETRVVRGECEPLVSARDGLQNLRVVDAVLEAAATGNTVSTIA